MLSKNANIEDLPLFPLPEVVLFPGCTLPLHIFEPRYREMVTTCLTNKEHVFGVLTLDPDTRKPSKVGCIAEIVEVERLPDGRMNILTMGRERFKVTEFLRNKPYLVGRAEFLEDEPAEGDAVQLAEQMQQLLRDVVRLSAKLADKEIDFPADIPTGPQELSFWVAGSFPGLPDEQQILLEMRDTGARLEREFGILQAACKQLAARAAIKDAFETN